MKDSINSIHLVRTERPHIFNVKLHLPGKVRIIGVLDTTEEGTFHTIRKDKDKHYFHANDSIGLNYELLTSPEIQFKWIVVHFRSRLYITTRQYALKMGKCLQFKGKGFELQVFVPLEEMDINIARAFEEKEEKLNAKNLNNESKELSLFDNGVQHV